MSDNVIHPPRGFCIAFLGGNGGMMVGPYATEAEAREALSNAHIVVVGAPDGWHEWCGATEGALFCSKPKGHEEIDDWHDNGSVAWPADREVTEP